MSPFNKIAAALVVLSMSAGMMAAPSQKEVRTRAIDLISEGQTLENQGDRQAAYQKYYESAQIAPSPSAYYHLGRLSRLSGQKDAARQWLGQALTLNPKFELAKVELMQLNDGASTEAPVVKTVSAEMKGSVAPGTAQSMSGPMNVDALRREVVTMQSLAAPQTAGGSITDQSAVAAASGTRATEAANETKAPAALSEESAVPASPGDIELAGRREDANNEVSDILSPTLESTEQGSASLPSLTSNQVAAAGDGKPSRAELNDAAFGEASQKDPGSKGYGQTNEVALGTFAFHREKGDDYRKANRLQDAAVEYKMALELNPNDAETRSLLAEMYGRIGAPNRAQAQFAKAKAQAPNDDAIYYKEGNAYFDEQKYDLAIGSFRKAIDLNPSNKLALNNMGVAYMEKKDYTTAADKFKKVLELDPTYEMAVLNLGIIYDEHIVDKEQALKYYDRYLELKGPRSTEVQRWADAIRARASQ
jgi:tetratricopeptide (TPR) repeat protein